MINVYLREDNYPVQSTATDLRPGILQIFSARCCTSILMLDPFQCYIYSCKLYLMLDMTASEVNIHIRPLPISGFCSMTWLVVFLLSLYGMLVHHKVPPPPSTLNLPLSIYAPSGEGICGCKVSYPRTQHNELDHLIQSPWDHCTSLSHYTYMAMYIA